MAQWSKISLLILQHLLQLSWWDFQLNQFPAFNESFLFFKRKTIVSTRLNLALHCQNRTITKLPSSSFHLHQVPIRRANVSLILRIGLFPGCYLFFPIYSFSLVSSKRIIGEIQQDIHYVKLARIDRVSGVQNGIRIIQMNGIELMKSNLSESNHESNELKIEKRNFPRRRSQSEFEKMVNKYSYSISSRRCNSHWHNGIGIVTLTL